MSFEEVLLEEVLHEEPKNASLRETARSLGAALRVVVLVVGTGGYRIMKKDRRVHINNTRSSFGLHLFVWFRHDGHGFCRR